MRNVWSTRKSTYKDLGSTHPFVTVWRNMHARCYNLNNNRYKNYGARGITVCAEWHNFDIFYTDMFSQWHPSLQLERDKNDLPYCKENCRWATRAEQSQNRTNSKLTKEQALAIRKLFRPGAAYQEQLAKQFGVSSRMIRYIAAEGAWK